MNLFKQFLSLLPPRPLEVGTVQAIHNGIASITLPGGGNLQARGADASITVGQRVFVRDGLIEGPAPELTHIEGEV